MAELPFLMAVEVPRGHVMPPVAFPHTAGPDEGLVSPAPRPDPIPPLRKDKGFTWGSDRLVACCLQLFPHKGRTAKFGQNPAWNIHSRALDPNGLLSQALPPELSLCAPPGPDVVLGA